MFASGRVLYSIAGFIMLHSSEKWRTTLASYRCPNWTAHRIITTRPSFPTLSRFRVVPKTNSEFGETGAVLTMIAYLGRRDMYLLHFTTNLLQGKITRDENSNAMLDLLFQNTFYDPGIIFFNLVKTASERLYMNFSGEFVSTLTKAQKPLKRYTDLEEIMMENN